MDLDDERDDDDDDDDHDYDDHDVHTRMILLLHQQHTNRPSKNLPSFTTVGASFSSILVITRFFAWHQNQLSHCVGLPFFGFLACDMK